MAQEIELQNKFVIAFDTICDGWNCVMESNEDDEDVTYPSLYDSEDEAFKEIFDGNLSMLKSHLDDDMLKEYNPDVTPELINTMDEILKYGDVDKMRKFMDLYPQCDDSGQWVEPAETFVMNRKAFFTEQGVVITGTKLILQ